MSNAHGLIQKIEELSFNAMPALKETMYDGWLLRFSGGYTRRANSVNPIYHSNIETLSKIKYCEQSYQRENIPLIFKMTDLAFPLGLDQLLAEQGFKESDSVSVQIAEIAGISPDIQAEEMVVPDDKWVEAYLKMMGYDIKFMKTVQTLAAETIPEKAFMRISVKGETVAVGYAAVEDGFTGIFDLAVTEKYRQKGYGRQLMLNLLEFGRKNGAQNAYLQVIETNKPALALYSSLGFKETYKYWYRIK
ncbi:MAG: GNAT family N-acetyltransferase [Candidatus Goldiibacteriota bacterium HGW-Goldbacteria-1]|jgi:ribosomal protein S18 acetylase RimI-like enzyme|nr:MAG: GNAT family N-acetyltransferase [Candidatus Goldiibacteriota bacterium HGW-Goldbacteria-1]